MIEIKEKTLTGYKFIDLFCGIGGFHLALESFGAECVFASDINVEACKVYKNNFGIEPKGDITKIATADIPAHDIICAGFPCQPFSISGNKQGFDDEKGRGKLFFNIVEIAKESKPKIILLENVKNFKRHDKGNTLTRVKKELDDIGYSVYEEVLCASDYGVPQARKRIYIVAFRKDLNIDKFEFPKVLEKFNVVKDILESKKENGYNVVVDRITTIDSEKASNIKRSRKLERIGEIGLGRQGERIYSPLGQATTLSTQGGGIGGKTGMYLIDGVVRKLYPRECARLMGFPDNFKYAGTLNYCYEQFGNSVVVDVLQYIIIGIIDKLKEKSNI